MYKEGVVYVYNRYYSDIKKNEILPLATMWMNLESIMLTEVNQAKKNSVCHLYVESKNKQTNVITKQKQTDIENKLVITSGERG